MAWTLGAIADVSETELIVKTQENKIDEYRSYLLAHCTIKKEATRERLNKFINLGCSADMVLKSVANTPFFSFETWNERFTSTDYTALQQAWSHYIAYFHHKDDPKRNHKKVRLAEFKYIRPDLTEVVPKTKDARRVVKKMLREVDYEKLL